MTSNSTNSGASVSATNAYTPVSTYSDGTKLYVADTGNNRILIWNTMPTTNGATPSIALGQPNMTSNAVGTTATNMGGPSSVYSDGTRLFAVDNGNVRVLIWNTIPTSATTPANVVLGQPNMTSNTFFGAATATTFMNPSSVASDGTRLFLADSTGYRILIWNTIPTTNTAPANIALGQPNMTSFGVGVSATQVNMPSSVYSDGTKLYVADYYRVLIWNTIPTSNTAPANVVLGQPNMTSTNSGASATNFANAPGSVYTDGTRLYVADTNNYRVLVWSTIPTASTAPANAVLGQPNMTSNTSNDGGFSNSSLSGPTSVYSDGTRIIVSDKLNNRVILFPIP